MPTTELAMWDLVVGFLSATFILPVIQQPRWSDQTRALITFGWSVVTGAVTAILSGAMDGVHDWKAAVSSILLVLVTAIATYRGFAKPTKIAPAIESATSGAKHRAPG